MKIKGFTYFMILSLSVLFAFFMAYEIGFLFLGFAWAFITILDILVQGFCGVWTRQDRILKELKKSNSTKSNQEV